MSFFAHIFKSCWQYRLFYGLSFLFLVLTNFSASKIPWCLKNAMDKEVFQGVSFEYWRYPLYIIGLAFLQLIFRSISRILVYRACREQEHDLRESLVRTILSIPIRKLEEKSSGELLTNLVEDTSQVRIFVGFGFIQAANISLVYSIFLPSMWQISPHLTLYAVAPYPIVLIYIAFLNQKLYYLNLKVKEKLSEVTEFCSQLIYGIHVAKSFQAYDGMQWEFDALNDEHYRASLKSALLDAMLLPGMIFFASLGEWFLIREGSALMIQGEITRGDFLAIHGYVAYILFASISVGFGMSTFNRGYTSYTRLHRVFSLSDREPWDRAEPTEPENLCFKNFAYSYTGEDCSLEINQMDLKLHRMIGICGPIGAGKSTFYRILQGLDQKYEGEVLFDESELRSEIIQNLRSSISVVDQEVFLFSQSIRENISLFSELSDDEIWKCLEFADLASDVRSFEKGLSTIIGEKGVRLSLGQKQRLSIARAIAHKSPIMIFDDCFSALDTVTEERILQNLLSLRGKATVFLTSHRISTLKHCDETLVFENGKLTAKGTHDELLKVEGFYSQMHKVQQEFGQL